MELEIGERTANQHPMAEKVVERAREEIDGVQKREARARKKKLRKFV